MNQFYSVLGLTRTASATVTAHTFVSATGAPATAAGNALGVARTDADSGDEMLVDAIGTAMVRAGGAITDGAEIEVAAGGEAVVQSAGVTVARALHEAADGELVEVLLIPN